MLIRCSALGAALLAACAAPGGAAREGSAPLPTVVQHVVALEEKAQPADPGLVALKVDGVRVESAVTVDRADIGTEGPRDVAVLAQRGALVVLTDSYGSRPQGLSRCQAGNEVYARVIDVRAKRERYAKLVESCLRPVISGSPAHSVAADGGSVTFDLIGEPPVTVTLGGDGSVGIKP